MSNTSIITQKFLENLGFKRVSSDWFEKPLTQDKLLIVGFDYLDGEVYCVEIKKVERVQTKIFGYVVSEKDKVVFERLVSVPITEKLMSEIITELCTH